MTIILTKRIASLRRMTNSRDGSPRYFVTFTDGTAFQTALNSACNYYLANSEFQDRDILVTFESGLITYIELPDRSDEPDAPNCAKCGASNAGSRGWPHLCETCREA